MCCPLCAKNIWIKERLFSRTPRNRWTSVLADASEIHSWKYCNESVTCVCLTVVINIAYDFSDTLHFKIWGSHGGDYEHYCHMWFYTVYPVNIYRRFGWTRCLRLLIPQEVYEERICRVIRNGASGADVGGEGRSSWQCRNVTWRNDQGARKNRRSKTRTFKEPLDRTKSARISIFAKRLR
jgi:hypothetical protein